MENITARVFNAEMFPCFDAAHYALSAIAVRKDLGARYNEFAHEHPFACWASYLLVIFAGAIAANALLAEPILSPLANNPKLITATLIWYAVFYSPWDYAHSALTYKPVHLCCVALKEVARCRKIHDGVIQAAALYPNAYLIMAIVATLRGNGDNFTRVLERLIRGDWTPNETEFLKPSYNTKVCILAAAVFIANDAFLLLQVETIYFAVLIVVVHVKVCMVLFKYGDPFEPLETAVCGLVFAGNKSKLE